MLMVQNNNGSTQKVSAIRAVAWTITIMSPIVEHKKYTTFVEGVTDVERTQKGNVLHAIWSIFGR